MKRMLTLLILLPCYSVAEFDFGNESSIMIMKSYVLKDSWFTINCRTKDKDLQHVSIMMDDGTSEQKQLVFIPNGDKVKGNPEIHTSRDVQLISITAANFKINITKSTCGDTSTFWCVPWFNNFKNVARNNRLTVIDNKHKVMLTYNTKSRRESEIDCKCCNLPKVDLVKQFGESFNLSCSTLMPFPRGQKNPNRFRWFVDDYNNGTYRKITRGFTNSFPESDNVQQTPLGQCVSVENKTSVLTYKHEKSESKLIKIKCQVVLKVKGLRHTRETSVRVYLSKDNKVLITPKKTKCRRPAINCTTCSTPGVNIIKMFGESFQLSCSTLMAFPSGQKNTNRLSWFIDNFNNGTYREIAENFTNSVPSSDGVTVMSPGDCFSFMNRTSDLTYPPNIPHSQFINIRCQVVYKFKGFTQKKATTVKMCFCKKNDTHTVVITHDKKKCYGLNASCETCNVPGINVIKKFGESIQLSCSTLMPFPKDQKKSNRFRWFIDHFNNGNFSEISQGLIHTVLPSEDLTKTSLNECDNVNYSTSILAYKPETWKSKFITIKCQVVSSDRSVSTKKATSVRVCFYEKHPEKSRLHNYILMYTQTFAPPVVIAIVVIAVVVSVYRKRRAELPEETRPQKDKESNTKTRPDNTRALPPLPECTVKSSKDTVYKSDKINSPQLNKETAAPEFLNKTGLEKEKIQRRKTLKKKRRSTISNLSKLKTDEDKSMSTSKKIQETSEYKSSPSTCSKSQRSSKISVTTSRM